MIHKLVVYDNLITLCLKVLLMVLMHVFKLTDLLLNLFVIFVV
jgi:hypothetical protein